MAATDIMTMMDNNKRKKFNSKLNQDKNNKKKSNEPCFYIQH